MKDPQMTPMYPFGARRQRSNITNADERTEKNNLRNLRTEILKLMPLREGLRGFVKEYLDKIDF